MDTRYQINQNPWTQLFSYLEGCVTWPKARTPRALGVEQRWPDFFLRPACCLPFGHMHPVLSCQVNNHTVMLVHDLASASFSCPRTPGSVHDEKLEGRGGGGGKPGGRSQAEPWSSSSLKSSSSITSTCRLKTSLPQLDET